MIIFDLDNTLSDASHRQHFVDPSKNNDYLQSYADMRWYKKIYDISFIEAMEKGLLQKFKPDWKSFYESCDKDTPIQPVIDVLYNFAVKDGIEFKIWSGRCESVKQKTLDWLNKYLHFKINESDIKMRPIGDSTPDEILKEMWLHDAMILEGKTIEFAFDDRKKVIEMWRRHGIFVFDVSQGKGDF